MSGKEKKMHGQPISREEVLQNLGHPEGWARDERRLEFQKRLRPGQHELDISGIKGSPGFPGYLDYLRASMKKPLGSDTSLVSDEMNVGIKAMVAHEIKPEIKKYEMLLMELEKSPEAIEAYIRVLRSNINDIFKIGLYSDQNPEEEPIEELREFAKQTNEEYKRNTEEAEREILKYSQLLAALQDKKE